MLAKALLNKITQLCGNQLVATDLFRDEVSVTTPPDALMDVIHCVRDDEELAFQHLIDITAVDHDRSQPHRFEVVYHLGSDRHGSKLRIKVPLPGEDTSGNLPELPSISSIWQGALWLERETYDMFGIQFRGHPSLQRILMTETMEGYPLRKDFPLHGPPEWPRKSSLKKMRKQQSRDGNAEE